LHNQTINLTNNVLNKNCRKQHNCVSPKSIMCCLILHLSLFVINFIFDQEDAHNAWQLNRTLMLFEFLMESFSVMWQLLNANETGLGWHARNLLKSLHADAQFVHWWCIEIESIEAQVCFSPCQCNHEMMDCNVFMQRFGNINMIQVGDNEQVWASSQSTI